MRQWIAAVTLTLSALCGFAQPAAAAEHDDFPNRPLRLVVPWPPGGLTDTVSRLVAQKLSDLWGQAVVVQNRAGANGIIGADFVAKSAPDGYTMVTANPETHGLNHLLYEKVPYDPLRDFEPVSLMVTQALVMVAHPSFAPRTIPELVAFAKQHPGKVRYSSWGRGSTSHLAMELLRLRAGIDLLHVPYKGAGPAFADVMGGQIDLMLSGIAPAVPQVRAGKVHAIAITSAARSGALPDVASVAEQGQPGYDMFTWYGVSVPKGTPAPIVAKLNEGIRTALRDPTVVERMVALGVEIVGSTPDAFRRFNAESLQTWSRTAEAAGVRPE